MNLLEVTRGYIFLNEKCVWCEDGSFVGVKSGQKYTGPDLHALPAFNAFIRSVDATNHTGMYHLNPGTPDDEDPQENRADWKRQFVGCRVTVIEAHNWGSVKVYRCLELAEYFSENELEILGPAPL